MNDPKLTEFEIDALRACYFNEYDCDALAPTVWAWSVTENCETVNASQISGVISSLVKKGVVKSQGKGEESVIYPTEIGVSIAGKKGWLEGRFTDTN